MHARPLGRRVYFAGEATEPVEYGTVHAALWSGEQAAEAIFRAATGVDCHDATRDPGSARGWRGPAQWVIERGRFEACMTLANILFVLVIVSGLATLGMLFAGLISMSPQRRPAASRADGAATS